MSSILMVEDPTLAFYRQVAREKSNIMIWPEIIRYLYALIQHQRDVIRSEHERHNKFVDRAHRCFAGPTISTEQADFKHGPYSTTAFEERLKGNLQGIRGLARELRTIMSNEFPRAVFRTKLNPEWLVNLEDDLRDLKALCKSRH